jgi:hypothetical protein
MSESIYESPPPAYTGSYDTQKYLKWENVSAEVKESMKDYVHHWFQAQTSQGLPKYPSINIPSYLRYVEKKKFFGSSTVVVLSHAIMEYLKDISFRYPYTLTYNNGGWSINIVCNMVAETNAQYNPY